MTRCGCSWRTDRRCASCRVARYRAGSVCGRCLRGWTRCRPKRQKRARGWIRKPGECCRLFGSAGPAASRLLLVIHHLAVDGVSWRILVPDLESAYAAVAQGGKPQLEPVATPFRVWAQQLAEQAQSAAVLEELAVWQSMLRDGGALCCPARNWTRSGTRWAMRSI